MWFKNTGKWIYSSREMFNASIYRCVYISFCFDSLLIPWYCYCCCCCFYQQITICIFIISAVLFICYQVRFFSLVSKYNIRSFLNTPPLALSATPIFPTHITLYLPIYFNTLLFLSKGSSIRNSFYTHLVNIFIVSFLVILHYFFCFGIHISCILISVRLFHWICK